MKEFTPDKYLGHKINRISRSIDRYFDRKRCSKTECIPRSQGMMIGYIMDNQDQNIFQKDIEAKFHLSGATVTNMLKSLEKNGYIVRTPMENDARLKRIELTQKALDHENRVRENIFQKDIEAKFHLSGATVTNMLKSLEKNGYIVRTPMENDARLKRIELTQKALDHENRVRENIMVIEEAMHEGFSKEEFNMMLGFLDRVIDNMEKLNK